MTLPVPYKPDYVIYHENCNDGFAAATLAWMNWGDTCKYIPSNYGKPLPDMNVQPGTEILVADFSLDPSVCEELVKKGGRIIMLDHHETARDKLDGFTVLSELGTNSVHSLFHFLVGSDWQTKVLVVFDNEKSGAELLWDFISNNVATTNNSKPFIEAPRMVRLVADRDLWKFEYGDASRHCYVYLQSLGFNFESWKQAIYDYDNKPEQVQATAAALYAYYEKVVDEIVGLSYQANILGYENVAVLANTPYSMASETCHRALAKYPDAPFAAAIIDRGESISISIRSNNYRTNVREVAEKFGGGGHRNAAGFTVKTLDDIKTVDV